MFKGRQVDAKAMGILAGSEGKVAEITFQHYGLEPSGYLHEPEVEYGTIGRVNRYCNIEIFDLYDTESGSSLPFIGNWMSIEAIKVQGTKGYVYDNCSNLITIPYPYSTPGAQECPLIEKKHYLNDEELHPFRLSSFGVLHADPSLDESTHLLRGEYLNLLRKDGEIIAGIPGKPESFGLLRKC
jgi:hypothetical protein